MVSTAPSRSPLTPDEAIPMTVLPTSISPAVPVVLRSHTAVPVTLSNSAIIGPSPSPPVTVTPDIPTNITASPFTFNIPNSSSQQQQTSVISCTTVGGCNFDALCRGAENYACDTSCLVNLSTMANSSETSETDVAVDEIVKRLKEKLEDNIRELERQRDGKVTKIYIGKTFIKKRKKRGGGFQQFDPMQPSTWKKNGISSHWGSHKRKKGKHGLIVLTAVTRKVVPKGVANQQRYALILEQKLIHRYEFDEDVRLENKSSGEGAQTKIICYGYALYVAFTFEKDADDDTMLTSYQPPNTSGLSYTNTIEDFSSPAIAESSNPQFTQPAYHIPVIVTPACARNAVTQIAP